MKTYYEMLEVAADATIDEIKRAFRREIAKYHPDKVQHLGQEFQDIAASKAAELTQAYKTLSDENARAHYDASLAERAPPAPAAPAASAPAAPRPASPRAHEPSAATPPSASGIPGQFASERHGVNELVRRAALGRFQAAVAGEFGSCEHIVVPGFEVAVIPASSFWSLKPPPRVLGRIVDVVDGRAIADTCGLAARVRKDGQRDLCVFLMGPSMAPAGELALAIAEQRKRPAPQSGKLVVVPVNTRNWNAHVPTDAPDVVRSLLSRLKAS